MYLFLQNFSVILKMKISENCLLRAHLRFFCYSKTVWKINLWVYFFNILLLKWSNLDFKPPFKKFGSFRAIWLWPFPRTWWFGILTASLKSSQKVKGLEEFWSFYSLEFGKLIVPQARCKKNAWALAPKLAVQIIQIPKGKTNLFCFYYLELCGYIPQRNIKECVANGHP